MSDQEIPVLPEDEYLTEEQVQHLYGILRERADKLLDTSRDSLIALTAPKELDTDAVDQAANESDRGFSLRLADRDRQMLKKIRYALARFTEGEYGMCEACGAEIGYKRLLARPVASLCIDCKTQAERREHRRWSS